MPDAPYVSSSVVGLFLVLGRSKSIEFEMTAKAIIQMQFLRFLAPSDNELCGDNEYILLLTSYIKNAGQAVLLNLMIDVGTDSLYFRKWLMQVASVVEGIMISKGNYVETVDGV